MDWVNENIVALLAVIIAAGGLFAPLVTALIQRNTARSDRFTRAIEHLKNESLAIRMGALFELKKLGFSAFRDRDDILRILSSFMREHIENPEYLLISKKYADMRMVEEDVYIAGKIISLLFESAKTDYRVQLYYLEARKLYLSNVTFFNARLNCANFRDSILRGVNFQESTLRGVKFQGADLRSANLTVEQLLEAYIDEETLLDDHLANDPRIQARIAELAEQNQTPAN